MASNCASRGHRSCVNIARFSPDGRRIASAGDDGSAKVWDAETGEELFALRGHRGAFSTVAFSLDSRRIITAGADGAVKVWDATVSPEARTVSASDSAVLVVAFSPRWPHTRHGRRGPSSQALGGAVGQAARHLVRSQRFHLRHGLQSGWQTRRLGRGRLESHRPTGRSDPLGRDDREAGPADSAHPGIAWCVAFSPDSLWLVTGGGEYRTPGQEIIVWDVATGTRLRLIPVLKGGSNQVVFSPDGQRITATSDDLIQTWQARTGEKLATLEGHNGTVLALAYSPDGRSIFSGGEDGTVRVWDATSGHPARVLLAEKEDCLCLAVSPDGSRVASAGTDHTIKLWDPEIDQALITLVGHSDAVRSVAFSPDGRLIASADAKGKVKIWDATPWTESVSGNAPTSRMKQSR